MNVGDRVQLHPATDEWMSGDKFGVIVRFGHGVKGTAPVIVKLDVSGRQFSFDPDNILPIGD